MPPELPPALLAALGLAACVGTSSKDTAATGDTGSIGPCLDYTTSPCLAPITETAGPCLTQVAETGETGPCLSPLPESGGTGHTGVLDDSGGSGVTGGSGSPVRGAPAAPIRLEDVLPADVVERLRGREPR